MNIDLTEAEMLELPKIFQFHHIGYACKSIEKSINFFKMLGYVLHGDFFLDPEQGVRGCFLEGNGPRIELLEEFDGSNVLKPWLLSGDMVYHFAYRVSEFNSGISWATANGGRSIVKPVPAVAFDNKLITFFIFRNGFVLELIQD